MPESMGRSVRPVYAVPGWVVLSFAASVAAGPTVSA